MARSTASTATMFSKPLVGSPPAVGLFGSEAVLQEEGSEEEEWKVAGGNTL